MGTAWPLPVRTAQWLSAGLQTLAPAWGNHSQMPGLRRWKLEVVRVCVCVRVCV